MSQKERMNRPEAKLRRAGSETPAACALAILLTAGVLLGQAGGLLTGRVTDPQGRAVPGAVVALYARDGSGRLGAVTDQSGLYRFAGLAAGDYLLEVQASGFAGSAAQDVSIDPGRPTTIDLPLLLAPLREDVVVTASGRAQPVDEVSKSITVISRQEMAARDEFTVAEALRSVPGVRVQQLGGPGALTGVKMRGLPSEDTAVLIDGVRFRDAAAPQGDASAFLADLAVTGVERLEVLSGSGSSLYGTHAVGGVLNIVTDEGGGRTRGSVLAEGGGLGLFRGRAQAAGGLYQDRLSYSAAVSHLNVAEGVDGEDAARNTAAQGHLGWRLSPGATFSARIYTGDSFLQLNTSPQAIGRAGAGITDAAPLAPDKVKRYQSGVPLSGLDIGGATFIPSVNDPDASASARFFSGLLSLSHRITDAFGYSLTYHGVATRRTVRDGPDGVSFQPGAATRTDFRGNIQTLNLKGQMRVKFNFIDAGYEFENEDYGNRNFPESPVENSALDVTQRSSALFVQDQLRLLDDRLQLSAGFRAQFFFLKTPRFSPSAQAPYQGSPFKAPQAAYTADGSLAYFVRRSGTKIRGHVGNGYRGPSLFERFGAAYGGFGYFVFGDPRLRPERSIAFDLGLDQALPGGRARASATYFYTRLQETILFDFSGAINPATDPFGRFGGYRNAGGGLARGVETQVTGALGSSLDLMLAYTYTNSDQRRPLVDGVISAFIIPAHQFSLVATQRLGRRLSVNLDLTVSSHTLAPVFDPGTFSSRAYRFDGIARADLGVSYRVPFSDFRSLRFHGKVDNLLDREYFENGFRTPGAVGIAGVTYEF